MVNELLGDRENISRFVMPQGKFTPILSERRQTGFGLPYTKKTSSIDFFVLKIQLNMISWIRGHEMDMHIYICLTNTY